MGTILTAQNMVGGEQDVIQNVAYSLCYPAPTFGSHRPPATMLTGQRRDAGQVTAAAEAGAPHFAVAALPGPFVLGSLPGLPAPFTHPGVMLPPPFINGRPSDLAASRYNSQLNMMVLQHRRAMFIQCRDIVYVREPSSAFARRQDWASDEFGREADAAEDSIRRQAERHDNDNPPTGRLQSYDGSASTCTRIPSCAFALS